MGEAAAELIGIGIAAIAILWKKSKDAAEKEMDQNESRDLNCNGTGIKDENNDGLSLARAEEAYFLEAIKVAVKDRYPNFVRYEILNKTVWYRIEARIMLRIYLSTGEITYDDFTNEYIWSMIGLAEPVVKEVPVEVKNVRNEEAREKAIHSWMSKNIPNISLQLEQAKENGIKEVTINLPDDLTEEEISGMVEEMIPLFDWMVTVEGNKVSFKDIEEDAFDPSEIWDEETPEAA